MLAKRLRHSDCSYFERYHRSTGMRQKAINLDKHKMNALFPSLFDAENTARFPVQVNWFFSDQDPIETQQNVTLSEKNWRLNSMPWVDAEVEPDVTFVVCQILGDEAPAETRVPTGIALALVRPGDQGYDWLDARLPSGGFANIDDHALLAAENWAEDSAVWQLIDFLTQGLAAIVDDVLAEQGPATASRIGLRSIDRTGSTREAVERLSRLRSAIGLGGETLVDAVLELKCAQGEFVSHEWVSASNATAPVDFRAKRVLDQLGIEVKTTKGKHQRAFHISTPELREASTSRPYEIWRVAEFEFDDEQLSGMIRRADPSPLVGATLKWLTTSPEGVTVSSVEFSPAALSWTDPEQATCPVARVPSTTWKDEIDIAS